MPRFYEDEDFEKWQREHPNATSNESLAFLAGVTCVLDKIQNVVTFNHMIIIPKDEIGDAIVDDILDKPEEPTTNIIIFPKPDA